MKSSDHDREVSSTSASQEKLRVIGIGLAFGIVLVVLYISLSDGFNEGDERYKGDESSFSLNYSKYVGNQYASLQTPGALAKQESPVNALDKMNPEKKQESTIVETKVKSVDKNLAARLNSSMVVVYDQNGFQAQQNIAVKERLNNSSDKLTKEALLRRMIAHSKKTKNEQFAEKVYSAEVEITDATKLQDLEYTILQGKIIHAILETPINTNLPGMIKAVISRDVFGERGKIRLIPKGSRLIGFYNSSVIQGQARVFIIWSRVITPNFVNIRINSPGADQMGIAGMPGKVNTHFWKRFGNSILLSIIGAGTMVAGVSSNDQYNTNSSVREQIAANINSMSTSQLSNTINIKPTITVPQGTRIVVQVARDIKFNHVKDRY